MIPPSPVPFQRQKSITYPFPGVKKSAPFMCLKEPLQIPQYIPTFWKCEDYFRGWQGGQKSIHLAETCAFGDVNRQLAFCHASPVVVTVHL